MVTQDRNQGRNGEVSSGAALAIVGAVPGAGVVLGPRNAPDPSHPKIQRWYERSDKPSSTPPDTIFGAVWPALEVGLGVEGYRLLRHPAGKARNVAVGLWLLNSSMIGERAEIFFRKRDLKAGVVACGAMLATGVGYVAAAIRVDRPVATPGVPFGAWLGFATLLAERIREWNRDGRGAVA